MNMPSNRHLFVALAICVTALFSLAAQAAPVSYAAQLKTSRLNPVTDILILEADAEGTVHGTLYPDDLPGDGYAVILHDPDYEPVRSLVIGLTDGEDELGNDKIQLVMFLADDFAVANQSVNYSEAFPGARHSLTIESLLAAGAGDANALAWFTDTFFKGPAAAAVFDTHGSFTVAEFTALDTIGGAVTVGPWILNTPFQFIPANTPGSQGAYPTGVLDETATGPGPFDIEFSVDDNGVFAVDKSVENGTDLPMVGFTLQVGTGTGANFVPSDNVSLRRFVNEPETAETSGAFPDLGWSELQVQFNGALAPGETANFVFFVYTGTNGPHNVTVRQSAIYQAVESRATFLVSKDFTDGNPNEVTVSIDCNTGLILDQSKEISEGQSVEFVVTEFDSGELYCEISEAVPAGYSPTYGVEGNQGGTAGNISSDGEGCQFSEVAGGAFACQVVNTPAPVDIVITKEWVIEGSSSAQDIDTRYELTLRCDGEIIGGYYDGIGTTDAPAGIPQNVCGLDFPAGADSGQTVAGGPWCKKFFGDGPEVFTAEVIPDYPESDCEVVERVYDDAVEIDNGCGHLVFSAGQGASCVITNTVFFEGIPTMNAYGMALLALLMLGMGWVGFRRFT
ncbi:MAG TPA: IPTL-CTERM sorting domain-containing protein [Xanthomonadales bacterium]|nr:IPTL-CTERM sorting domain-containing protein [Xanthomonadales bacterium]